MVPWWLDGIPLIDSWLLPGLVLGWVWGRLAPRRLRGQSPAFVGMARFDREPDRPPLVVDGGTRNGRWPDRVDPARVGVPARGDVAAGGVWRVGVSLLLLPLLPSVRRYLALPMGLSAEPKGRPALMTRVATDTMPVMATAERIIVDGNEAAARLPTP